MTDIVIGSGPAGYSALRARLALGRKVTLIDAGRDLDPALAGLRDDLARHEPQDWLPEAEVRFRTRQLDAAPTIARYGSGHAVRHMQDIVADPGDLTLRSSHALGGLSNVWGAAVLPWSERDLDGWPIAADALTPHYGAVSQFLPLAGEPHAFAGLFETSALTFSDPLPETGQSRRLLTRLDRASDGRTLRTGPAWQAVWPGCRACGLCLYGCPYRLIFSSAAPVHDLRSSEDVAYVRGVATSLRETSDGVEVTLSDGASPVTGERVFVAAGVLETAQLMFASQSAIAEKGLTLKESRHFFTPFLEAKLSATPDRAPHHTLVQAFAELDAPDVSPFLIHTQIYGWNDFYAREMIQNYGRGITALAPAFRWLSRRLFAAQTFLHSDHCHRIALSPAQDDSKRLRAELQETLSHEATVRAARQRLARHLRPAGLFAVGRNARMDPPGGSFHTGATLPMSKSPGLAETDVLGRPAGSGRIHIVDSSVFPAIPATTITFSVMANAHRIATEA